MKIIIFGSMRYARAVFFIWICLLLCLMPFIILSFLNVMVSDDYILSRYFSNEGFWGMQQRFYLGWAGRYTSTFLTALFLQFNIISKHYYLVALFFYLFTGVGIGWLLQSINTCWLATPFKRGFILQASFILLVLQVSVLAEVGSAYYWWSAAVVYQTAFILFLFLCGCLIRRSAMAFAYAGKAWQMDAVIILLSILLCGCNEMAAVFLGCLLIMIIAAFYIYTRSVPRVVVLYFFVVVATGVLIACTSGVITVRHTYMTGHIGYLATLPIVLFRWGAVGYYLLSAPVFWICGGVLFFIGTRTKLSPVVFRPLMAISGGRFFVTALGAIFLMVFVALTVVLLVSKGSLPPRTLNNLISFSAFLILGVVFLAGARYGAGQEEGQAAAGFAIGGMTDRAPGEVISGTFMSCVLICALLANPQYIAAWKSTISGYFYHAVQEDRQQQLSAAREAHLRTATLLSYDDALQQKIDEVFPHGVPQTANEWLRDKPATLYYWNDAEPVSSDLLRYYDLDSITIRHAPELGGR